MGGVRINTFDSCPRCCTSPLGSAAAAAGSSRISKKPSRSGGHFSYRSADVCCSLMIVSRMSTLAATSRACIARISSLVILVFHPISRCFGLVHITRCKPSQPEMI